MQKFELKPGSMWPNNFGITIERSNEVRKSKQLEYLKKYLNEDDYTPVQLVEDIINTAETEEEKLYFAFDAGRLVEIVRDKMQLIDLIRTIAKSNGEKCDCRKCRAERGEENLDEETEKEKALEVELSAALKEAFGDAVILHRNVENPDASFGIKVLKESALGEGFEEKVEAVINPILEKHGFGARKGGMDSDAEFIEALQRMFGGGKKERKSARDRFDEMVQQGMKPKAQA